MLGSIWWKPATTLRFAGKIIFPSVTQNREKMIFPSWDVAALESSPQLSHLEAGARQ